MTKIITIGFILLTFAISMPACGMIEEKVKKSSSGLMTYANLNAIRNRKAKTESSEARHTAFENIKKFYENEEKNRKLTETKQLTDLPNDVLKKIGKEFKVNKELRSTCQDFAQMLKDDNLKHVEEFYAGKREFLKEKNLHNDVDLLRIFSGIYMRYSLSDRLSHAAFAKKVAHEYRETIKSSSLEAVKNHNDYFNAIEYAIAFDHDPILKSLLTHTKEIFIKRALYNDWILYAVEKDSQKAFELLLLEEANHGDILGSPCFSIIKNIRKSNFSEERKNKYLGLYGKIRNIEISKVSEQGYWNTLQSSCTLF